MNMINRTVKRMIIRITMGILIMMNLSLFFCGSPQTTPDTTNETKQTHFTEPDKTLNVHYEKTAYWYGIGTAVNNEGKVLATIKDNEVHCPEGDLAAYIKGSKIFLPDGTLLGEYYEETSAIYDANGKIIASYLGNKIVDRKTSAVVGIPRNQAHFTILILKLLKADICG